jgi:cytochrome c oxidase assembly factor CtaG
MLGEELVLIMMMIGILVFYLSGIVSQQRALLS